MATTFKICLLNEKSPELASYIKSMAHDTGYMDYTQLLIILLVGNHLVASLHTII